MLIMLGNICGFPEHLIGHSNKNLIENIILLGEKGGTDMRIDAYNQIGHLYQTTHKTKVQTTGKVVAKDELHISGAGRDYQIAKQAVTRASDIREDKVAAIKASMEAGTYQVSNSSFAEKLIEEYEKYNIF